MEAEAGSGLSTESAQGSLERQPIGAYLRRQRILRGMTAEELARLTHIPIRSLERLEEGRFDRDTDGFARGFVRTVSDALGLDADDTISRMLEEPGPGSWEHRGASRSVLQAAAVVALAVALVVVFLGLRAVWQSLLGEEASGSRAVVIWRDPVHALAEATGAQLEATPPRAPEDAPDAGEAEETAAREP